VSIRIAPLASEHLEGAVRLQRDCFPEPFPEELLWNLSQLTRHLEVFPEGQFVALDGDKVVASASATLISEENWQAHRSWEETVGGPYLTTFDPEGSTLYGLDISVHPEYRGRGLGRLLYSSRFDLVDRLGLTRYGTACRLPDFRTYAGANPGATVEEYAENVLKGRVSDRTLTPLLRYGLAFLGVIHQYMEDFESDNAAALLERGR
jgi:GNAT superfamily N-acetyltransferase